MKIKKFPPCGARDPLQVLIVGATVALLALGCLPILRLFISAALWAGILCFSTWQLFTRLEQLVGDAPRTSDSRNIRFAHGSK